MILKNDPRPHFCGECRGTMIVFEHWFTYTTPLNFTRFKGIIKAFSGMCVRLTSITFPVIWSSVLISVTREWCYCGLVYKFFLINNIELKCSFVRCRKYHKSWWNGAAELHISVDLLCGITAAELHSSVDLLCGTTAAWHNRRWASQLAGKFALWHNGRRAKQPGLMHAPGVARIYQKKNMKA